MKKWGNSKYFNVAHEAIFEIDSISSYISHTVVSLNIFATSLILFYSGYTKNQEYRERLICVPSATCFVFHEANETEVEVALVFNEEYSEKDEKGWWLAPGGHVALSSELMPSDVAKKRAEARTGTTIELMEPYMNEALTYRDLCKEDKLPQAIYRLKIPKYADCYRKQGHRYHLDFTYIAKTIERSIETDIKAGKACVWVKLQKVNRTRNDVNNAVTERLRAFYAENTQYEPPSTNHPNDFIDRLHRAFNAYCEISSKGVKE